MKPDPRHAGLHTGFVVIIRGLGPPKRERSTVVSPSKLEWKIVFEESS